MKTDIINAMQVGLLQLKPVLSQHFTETKFTGPWIELMAPKETYQEQYTEAIKVLQDVLKAANAYPLSVVLVQDLDCATGDRVRQSRMSCSLM